jgi:hypothetical protein
LTQRFCFALAALAACHVDRSPDKTDKTDKTDKSDKTEATNKASDQSAAAGHADAGGRDAAPTFGAAGSAAATDAIVPPVSITRARDLMPAFTADMLIPLQASSSGQVHATWCMAGTGAADVAKTLMNAMAGWRDIELRGDELKAGTHENVRYSFIVAASSIPSCKSPSHYRVAATIFTAPSP